MPKKLNEEQVSKIRKEFYHYKTDRNLTTKHIGKKLGICSKTVSLYFRNLFGEEYKKLAKRKSAWSTKVDENQVRVSFNKYKKGFLISQIEKELGLKKGALLTRFRKVIGKEYMDLARERKYFDAGRSRKNRISDRIIKNIFKKYKKTRIPIEKLAESIGIKESSLIDRFKRLFGDDYKKIAYNRRDERKVSKRGYEIAFERYKNSNISLTQLSEELNIKISSLAPRFKKMYGNIYTEIAMQKQDLIEVDRKGRIAEELAIEYFKIIGLKINDVRRKCIIKNTLKRPDFVVNNTFIEVKNNYITMEGFGNVKGYKKILNDYLYKTAMNGHETILKKGIIVSFGGFSSNVRKQATKDKIMLIGPKEIEETFKNNNHIDLMKKLNELRGFC